MGVAKRIGKIQRMAAIMITGGFRTTPTDTLNYLAGLPPIHLQLNHSAFKAAVRLSTLPQHHPLHKVVQRCMKSYPRFHRSPIHELFHSFPQLRNMETIDHTPLHPWRSPNVTVSIAPSRAQAIKDAKARGDTLCVYTDGSGYKGGIGAAAWAQTETGEETRQLYLGPDTQHTIFEGELCGAILGLNIIESVPRIRRATILIDNQATLPAIEEQPAKSGQYLTALFNHNLERIKRRRKKLHVHLTWVPGHSDVYGNEKVDGKAKRAAKGETVGIPERWQKILMKLPTSAAATRAEHKKWMAAEWKRAWRGSKHGKRMAKFDKTAPGKIPLRLYQDLSRRQCSILTQLRSDHIGLNQYLARFGRVNSSMCNKCNVPETVDHFLIKCRRYNAQRDKLKRDVKRPFITKRILLGSSKHRKALLDFVDATGRLARHLRPRND